MPRILDLQELRSCLDRAQAMEVRLDGPVSEDLIQRLGREGSLQYFPHFSRPHFRVDHATSWVVQGIVGTPWLRIQLFAELRAAARDKVTMSHRGVATRKSAAATRHRNRPHANRGKERPWRM